MASIIAVLSILVVAGAFMWMQPSKRDKRLAKLRSGALTQGFLVGSVKLPDTTEHGRVNNRFEIQTIYQIALKLEAQSQLEFTALRSTGESGIYLPDGWAWNKRSNVPESIYTALSTFLAGLPESVTALVVSKTAIGLVWDEKDPQLTLEQIKSMLHDVAGFCDLEPHSS